LVLVRLAEAEDLADRAEVLVGVDQFAAAGAVARDAGRELAAVLQVEQHPRHEPSDLVRIAVEDRRGLAIAEVVQGGHAAFVLEFIHDERPRETWLARGHYTKRFLKLLRLQWRHERDHPHDRSFGDVPESQAGAGL